MFMRRTILALLSACLLTQPLFAQSTGSPGDTLDEIIARGTVIIGAYRDYPPYSFEENGEIKGTDIEVGKIIAQALGVKPVFELRNADENVDADLRNHVWRGPLVGGSVVNIMLHMPLDPELSLRNDMVVMGGAYASEKTILAWSKSALGDVPTMTDFTEYKIAVENDSIADFYLGSFAGGGIIKNILHRKDIAAAAQELVSGEAAGLMGPLSQIEFELNKAGDRRGNYGVSKATPPGLSQGNWKYGFAVRMNYRDLFYATEEAIVTAVADGRVAAAFAKYGLTYSPPPAPEE